MNPLTEGSLTPSLVSFQQFSDPKRSDTFIKNIIRFFYYLKLKETKN